MGECFCQRHSTIISRDVTTPGGAARADLRVFFRVRLNDRKKSEAKNGTEKRTGVRVPGSPGRSIQRKLDDASQDENE
ncbi:hypothetical protein P3T18_002504 [Paraburkholderia sp. GAS199]|uniref:hypothetical protein n=1 Tax=Paraburkholderia sp. GAS199 TaxID=3035126 RepID=UPI003D1A51C1